MVLVFLYGLIDIAAAIILILVKFFPVLKIPAIVIALLVLFKSLRYVIDIASAADIIVAVFIVLAAIGYYPLFTYAVVIWLAQKGVRSFI